MLHLMKTIKLCMLPLCVAGMAPVAHGAPQPAAIFPFEFDDTSLEGALHGPRDDERARLRQLDAQLGATLAASGLFEAIDVGPVASQVNAHDLYNCDGCDVPLARRLGARVAVVGWVQKVSNLILNINLEVRDVADGHVLRAGSVDIRGNTDETWARGLAWLLRHRILPQP
jgi:hypothetical protein